MIRRKILSTIFVNREFTDTGWKTYAIPYLLVSKQYQKVVDQCQDFKKLMQEQDTVNLQYISILQKEVKAYKGLKDFEK